MGDWRGLSSGGNWLGGVQHFSPPKELSWGSLYLPLLLTWYLGSSWFLNRPPQCLLLLPQQPFRWECQWRPAGHSQEKLSWSGPQETLLVGLQHPGGHHQRKEMYHSIVSLNSRTLPHQDAWLAWHRKVGISPPNTGEPVHRPQSSPTVPP